MRKAVRNKWKRVLAVVLAAAMSLTMLPVDTQAAAKAADDQQEVPIEIVENGDFSNGTTGWEGFSGAQIEVVTMDDGPVLKVSGRNQTEDSAACILNGKLAKGTHYKITGKIKYDGEKSSQKYRMVFQNGPGWQYRYAFWGKELEVQKGTWGTFTLDDYVPDDVTNDKGEVFEFSTTENCFFIETLDNNMEDFYIDDISITYMGIPGQEPEKPEEPEAESLLSNGSFENVPIDKNWAGMGKTHVARVENVAHEGNASLKVSDYTENWEGAKYELFDLLEAGKLVGGKKYTLTAWAKTESGSGSLSATIKGKEKGATQASYLGFCKAVEVDSTKWTKITGEITLADYDPNTDVMEVYWSWGKTVEAGAPSVFYLDDVSLTMPSENIVRNGSFEKDLEKWTGYEKDGILTAVTEEAHSGSKSVKVSNRAKNTNGPAQEMGKKLTPGSYYTVSAWIKYKDENNAPAERTFNVMLHSGKESAVLATGKAKKGEWTKIEGDWGMPYDMSGASNILTVETPAVVTAGDAADVADFYVDDVTILKYKDDTQTLAKKFGYGNPITTNEFGADPYAIEYNGRVYVYMTADDYEFSDKDNPFSNNFGYITSLRVVSSADLMNWTDHGEIKVAGKDGAAKWASHSWAPAIAHKEINGKEKFFLYFANDASGIGVLTADTPLGPWTDPTVDAQNPNGKAMITGRTPGCEGVVWCFDPAVLVDDDGNAYIYFGGGVPEGQHDNPKTARVAKLSADMTSIEGEAKEIDAPCMFEDSGIFKFGDTYYYSYCSNFTNTTVQGYPGTGTICYMTSKNPMGPFTYEKGKGEIFSNPQVWFGVGGNNHHATFVFNGKSYFIYHAQTVSKALGVERGYRSTHIDEIALDKDGKIKEIAGTYEGIPQLTTMNPYERIEAETIAWNAGVKASETGRPGNLFEDYNMVLTDLQEGDWTSVSQLEFGTKGADKITVAAGSKSGGKIEVRVGYPEGKKIGEIEVPATGSNHTYKLVTGDIEKVTGTQNIFLVFHEKEEGATTSTETYQKQLKDLWTAVKAAESSLPLKEQLQRQITKAHNVSSGFAWNEGDKKAALDAKVNAAQAVANNGSATDEQLKAAIVTLNEAIDAADQYKETDKLLKEKLKYRIKYAEQLAELTTLPAAQKPLLQAVINSSKQLLKDDSIMNVDYFQFTEEGGNVPTETPQTKKQELEAKIVTAKDVLATLGADKRAALQAAIDAAEAVLKDANATESDFTTALGELNTAIENAETTTSKDELQAQIAIAKGMLANLSAAKKTALEAAITKAEGVLNNATAEETAVQTAITELKAAIDEAAQVTPKDELTVRLGIAKDMLAGLSESKKAALQAAIDEAEAVLNNASASDDDVKSAMDKLNEAIQEAYKSAKEQLSDKIAAAKAMLNDLSGDKKAALQAAITKAEGVLNKAGATEDEFETALTELKEAIEEAGKPDTPPVEKPVKEQLSEKIDAAKAMLENLSGDKKAALEAAITKAEGVLNNPDSTDDQIKAALDELNDAIKEAGGEQPPAETPKEQLSNKIADAEALLAKLSGDKKTALEAAIAEAKKVLDNPESTDEQIKDALAKLTAAITEAEKPGGNQPGGNQPGGNQPGGNQPTEEKPGLNQTFTENSGLTYKVTAYSANDKSVTVTGASKQLTSIVIPDTIVYRKETFKVTAIGDSAFANQASLTSVTIGKNVTTIGAKAFFNAKKLKKITFQGAAVKTIGKDAFKNIDKKATFTMPKAFTNKNLKYKITKCTASAKEVAVTGAAKKNLTTLSVPATVKYNGMTFKVTSVGKKAFRKQAKLKSVTIGKNVKSIGASAFDGDKKLAKIKFSGTAIKSIGKNAFKGIKKNAKFTVKKSKKAYYKKLLKKAKTKNFKI